MFSLGQEQIMPGRLIGEGEELERAYQLFLIEQKKNEDNKEEEESDSEVDYHEGFIPR